VWFAPSFSRRQFAAVVELLQLEPEWHLDTEPMACPWCSDSGWRKELRCSTLKCESTFWTRKRSKPHYANSFLRWHPNVRWQQNCVILVTLGAATGSAQASKSAATMCSSGADSLQRFPATRAGDNIALI
jgi:hypothetical protein